MKNSSTNETCSSAWKSWRMIIMKTKSCSTLDAFTTNSSRLYIILKNPPVPQWTEISENNLVSAKNIWKKNLTHLKICKLITGRWGEDKIRQDKTWGVGKKPKINKRHLLLVWSNREYSYKVIWNIIVQKTVEQSEEDLTGGFSS